MHSIVDERLRVEAAAFELRFSCEHCVHAVLPELGCSLGYPNDEHRSASLEGRQLLTFCKEFDLR